MKIRVPDPGETYVTDGSKLYLTFSLETHPDAHRRTPKTSGTVQRASTGRGTSQGTWNSDAVLAKAADGSINDGPGTVSEAHD